MQRCLNREFSKYVNLDLCETLEMRIYRAMGPKEKDIPMIPNNTRQLWDIFRTHRRLFDDIDVKVRGRYYANGK